MMDVWGKTPTLTALEGAKLLIINALKSLSSHGPLIGKYAKRPEKNGLFHRNHKHFAAVWRLLEVPWCQWQRPWLKAWRRFPTLQYLSQYPMLWFVQRGASFMWHLCRLFPSTEHGEFTVRVTQQASKQSHQRGKRRWFAEPPSSCHNSLTLEKERKGLRLCRVPFCVTVLTPSPHTLHTDKTSLWATPSDRAKEQVGWSNEHFLFCSAVWHIWMHLTF